MVWKKCCTLITSIALLITSATLGAKDLSFPQAAPLVDLSFPEVWQLGDEEEDTIDAHSEDEQVYFYMELNQDADDESALKGAVQWLDEGGVKISADGVKKKVEEINDLKLTVANYAAETDEGECKAVVWTVAIKDDDRLTCIVYGTTPVMKKAEEDLRLIMNSLRRAEAAAE
jgi:hypothetical protein